MHPDWKGTGLCAAVVVADQALKALMGAQGAKVLAFGLFRLRVVHNTGMAFSLFEDRPQWLTLAVAAVLLLLAAYLICDRAVPRLARAGLWMALGGGVGNLIDRLRFGAVIDYIEPLFVRFAVFNFADICVCVGAALTAWAFLRKEGARR